MTPKGINQKKEKVDLLSKIAKIHNKTEQK